MITKEENSHPLFESLPKANTTPMMLQYFNIKSMHQEYLLFYRLGDFYELFFNDAIIAAEVLDIALTKRGKHNNEDIPMCGVPSHAYEYYLERLIKAGYKVAICEQIETPEEAKKRGYKEVVRREVIRIVTPGTILEESLLEAKQTNYLCSIAITEGVVGIAWIDISTGEFNVCTANTNAIQSELSRLSPSELIIQEKLLQDEEIKKILYEYQKNLSVRANNIFDLTRNEMRLKQFYNLSNTEGLNNFSNAEMIAGGVLLEYIEHTQKSSLPKLNRPKKLTTKNFMHIDPSTRKNLEIERNPKGEKKNSLLNVIDKTLTSPGGRLLSIHLSSPLCNVSAIEKRLDNIECFAKQTDLRTKIRELLKFFPDMERAVARISAKRASPKDLGVIRDGLEISLLLAETLTIAYDYLSSEIRSSLNYFANIKDILIEIKRALKVELPFNIKEGNFIAESYNTKLDELRDIKTNVNAKLAQLRDKYQSLTGITNLKITFNNVIGYYVEITPSNAKKITEDLFIHRQTLGNSLRYTTEELKKLEADITSCDEKLSNLEREIYFELCNFIITNSDKVFLISQSIAMLDISAGLAELAKEMNYTRPIIDNSNKFEIIEGRHPIVEKNLKSKFIANDCNLNNQQNLWLITGPNMAGKSTFLRQNALIAILAQIGSFVPAKSAHIGIVDKLFSRIGAGDDISRGQSTFLVEMIETATILNNATSNSLVILDELGRGTSTYDGLSIAWATIECLHNIIKSRTLFATHFHELTELEVSLTNLRCYTMKVTEWENKVIFMHEVTLGKAAHSYGIHVAELAGIPIEVIQRANNILSHLQGKEVNSKLPIGNLAASNQNYFHNAIENKLKEIDIDTFTPREAFDILYQLKNMVK